MFAIELKKTQCQNQHRWEVADHGIPKCIKHLSSRNPWNLIHRKHVQLRIPGSKRIDDRLVLYGIQERNEGAPFLQIVDLGSGHWGADFEQDIRGSVEFFFGHKGGTGGFVVFIGELRGSSSVPLNKDLGHPLLQKQRGVLWCESDSALIGKSF
jgi:hypothetical protein